jgi:hypothetical protein
LQIGMVARNLNMTEQAAAEGKVLGTFKKNNVKKI